MKKAIPYLLILIGIVMMLFFPIVQIAGICLLLGIVMIIESIWPEEWEAEKLKKAVNSEKDYEFEIPK